jgi:hypothetical protein
LAHPLLDGERAVGRLSVHSGDCDNQRDGQSTDCRMEQQKKQLQQRLLPDQLKKRRIGHGKSETTPLKQQ